MSETMKWIEVDSYEEMGKVASHIFEEQLITKPDSVLGLATGGTPEIFYKELVKAFDNGRISFEKVKVFNLDEYVGIPANSSASYCTYMQEHLFKHVNILNENIHIPNGQAEALEEECKKYEESIEKAGLVDLQLLGIGINGHIGFNEPGTPFDSLTHIVELNESTRNENAVYFDNPKDVPKFALTMGIQSIMRARAIVLIAFGEKKLAAIERLRSGKVTEEFPASQLLNHPNVTVIYGGVQ